jgi:hypothetical protein
VVVIIIIIADSKNAPYRKTLAYHFIQTETTLDIPYGCGSLSYITIYIFVVKEVLK